MFHSVMLIKHVHFKGSCSGPLKPVDRALTQLGRAEICCWQERHQKMSPNCSSKRLITCWHCCSTSSHSSVTSHVYSTYNTTVKHYFYRCILILRFCYVKIRCILVRRIFQFVSLSNLFRYGDGQFRKKCVYLIPRFYSNRENRENLMLTKYCILQ